MPFVIALALLRRPGVGLLTALIAGIINAALTPQGASAIITCLMVGAMLEIPLAIGLYRSWRAWIYYVGAAVFGLGVRPLYSAAYLGVTEFAPVGAGRVRRAQRRQQPRRDLARPVHRGSASNAPGRGARAAAPGAAARHPRSQRTDGTDDEGRVALPPGLRHVSARCGLGALDLDEEDEGLPAELCLLGRLGAVRVLRRDRHDELGADLLADERGAEARR